jgi:glycosyltransferase involved in cell wall biosynthesis
LIAVSVGRLDAEKNPFGLVEVAQALSHGSDWHLVICGEGPFQRDLEARLRELGISDRAEVRGYVHHDELRGLYLKSHALLHVSWTEGVPQVLFEAFASALPVVATDVGGIREATRGAVAMIPPGDPSAAAAELGRIASDPRLRDSLIASGLRLVRARNLQSQTDRVAEFLANDGRPVAIEAGTELSE